MSDSYLTLAGTGNGYYESKKSKFYGICRSVSSREDAAEFFAAVKERYKDASHYVMAFTLRNGTAQASDDGEPSGTAGKPLLDCIERQGITDAAVVVVRYFGGTLLGTGGLVRAYSSAAAECVQDAGTCEMRRAAKIEAVVDYSLIKPAQLMFAEMGAVTEDTEYSGSVKFTVWCLEDAAPSVIARLRDMSSGSAVTNITAKAFKPETFFAAKK